jgi:ABC-type multidrug transport system fused ATPase/permease subunit
MRTWGAPSDTGRGLSVLSHREVTLPGRPATVPWRRVARLLRPLRWGLVGMVALSAGGVLVGLVPPLLLGLLVDALVEHDDKREAALLSVAIAGALLVQAIAYVLSDGMYYRNAGRLHRSLRLRMFDGLRHRGASGDEEQSGIPSRFISDVLTVDQITVGLLDTGSMVLVQFVSAAVAIGLLEPVALAVIFPMLGAIWVVTRRTQEPAATAGLQRQEELERLTRSISRELVEPDADRAKRRFRVAVERVMRAEIRYGWLQAFNTQGSGGLAMLGPIAVVVTAAFAGTSQIGTLLALYLLAQRAFSGFDGIVDLSLANKSVRGAVNRCFEYIDAESDQPSAPAV